MPITLNPNNENALPESVKNVNYGYKYPNGLKLKPGSDLHTELVKRIRQRADDSFMHMSKKYNEWQEVDDTLRAYVYEPREETVSVTSSITTNYPLSEDERDEDDFTRIVMPVSYLNLEVLLTYMTAAFWQDPIFRYEGVGPEDVYGAMLMEKKIAMDCRRFKAGLALHTHWRDGFTYGFGVITPKWTVKYGYRAKVRETGFLNRARDMFIATERNLERDYGLTFEGNELQNIDPYRYLPDPNVPVHEVQNGEFVGWVDRDRYITLLDEEGREESDIFNVKYVKHTGGRSAYIESRTQRAGSDKEANVESTSPVDVVWMYINLVPSDWKLGDSDRPEKWLFGLAADSIIITARPADYTHNMFPVAVCAPDYDGYSVAPTSRLSMVSDLQNLVDFMYSSHVMNVRKAINDMLVVDPAIVNIWDVREPSAGKIIRLRRSMWGRGNIDQAIKQLDVKDVTQSNVADSDYLFNFMQRILGSNDVTMGELVHRGPRISSAATRGARSSVLSRYEKTAKIIDTQSHQDIAYQMAFNTQQLLKEDTYIKAVGEWAEKLKEEFGVDVRSGRLRASPLDMAVNYDIIPHSGNVPGSEDPELWTQLMSIAGQIPQVAAVLDWQKVFKHVSRQLGAKNIDDFIRQTTPQVMPDEQVQALAQQGNAVPLPTNGQA